MIYRGDGEERTEKARHQGSESLIYCHGYEDSIKLAVWGLQPT